jgi:Resolvase, N terminal domain/Helix-turn-helix domain of resolvase
MVIRSSVRSPLQYNRFLLPLFGVIGTPAPQSGKPWTDLVPCFPIEEQQFDRKTPDLRRTGFGSQRGVQFRSLSDAIDTSTAQGKFFFHVLSAFAEMERSLIRERVNSGLAAAHARGRKGGRKPKLSAQQICHTRKLLPDQTTTIKEVAETLGVTRATVYRALGLGNFAKLP